MLALTQAIITVAFVDDILSLLPFNVLFSSRGEFNVMTSVVSPISGTTLMISAMYRAGKFWPRARRMSFSMTFG